jgi:TrmH family RNA methyltransferase
VKHIASSANPLYRTLCKLARSSRERRKQALTLIDGVHLLDAYLRQRGTPQQVLVARTGSSSEITAVIERLPAPPVVLADALFESLTELRSPSGILAVIRIPSPQAPAPPGCWLLLEDIQDPGNLGSVLRSAAAAGASDAWLSQGCADVWSPKVLRAGMGAHFSLRLHDRADLANAALRCTGRVVALTADGARSIFELDLTGPTAFALGNEGAGLSGPLCEAATERAAIPMAGHTESLNVAAAAAICLFERVRQLGRARVRPSTSSRS